uniref:Fibrinogen C-terminal domain-containing protein n=1 Tax=Anopheles christyi TaxID=43041 RepID=A0A182JV12_9DIPT
MLLAVVFLVFGAVQITNHQHLLNAHRIDLQGFHFELLLTHLTELENRLQTTLHEIAQNQSQQLEQLKLLRYQCDSTLLHSDTLQPNSNYRLENISGLSNVPSLDGEWIVFQYRSNGSVDFNRTWDEYRTGFGSTRGEHWLGLAALEQILTKRSHELLIVMENFKGTTVYAHYAAFRIGTEQEKYAITTVGKYDGTAGDSLSFHNGSKFTTFDQDNDRHTLNCATVYGGGWWFKDCYSCFLNGVYITTSQGMEKGLIWYSFTGPFESLKSTKMMIRPTGAL